MPLILPANTLSAAGYNVDNSCRFNRADGAYMAKTPSSGGSDTIATFSAWIKRAATGEYNGIFTSNSSTTNFFEINFESGADSLEVRCKQSGSYVLRKISNASYRDLSAWYHICVGIDTTDGVAEDRVKIYVNGVKLTSFSTNTTAGSSTDLKLNNTGYEHRVGRDEWSSPNYFNGYMAEVYWIDGTVYAASDFGEFDEDSPTIWKPKDASGDLTFGTNGFYLDFADSDNLGDDESGNTLDLAETNLAAVDQCQDSPTNNFATFNPLARNPSDTGSLSEGNVKYSLTSYQYNARSTIGVNSGKWYFETKITSTHDRVGIVTSNATNNLDTDSTAFHYGGAGLGAIAIMYNNGLDTTISKTINDTSNVDATATGTAWSAGDILMCAFDLDNNRIYWGEGGTWYFSADPEDGTNAISISNSGGDPWHVFGGYGTDASRSSEWNFGNPSFTIASSNADGNGYGNFEFAPPSGFLSMCSLNLGSTGG